MASDGLAPARCGELVLSLLTPRLAAPGAGFTHTEAAATWRSFAAAGVALRDAQSQMRACDGGQARATRSAQAGCEAAPRTLGPWWRGCGVGGGEEEAAASKAPPSVPCLEQAGTRGRLHGRA
eukprot:SAG11_NODE_6911_length_1226_cov_2.850932_2_plen_123_part_00